MQYGTVRRRRIPLLLAAMALLGSLLSACSTVTSAATWNDPYHPVADGSVQGAGPAPLWTGAGQVQAKGSAGSTTGLSPAYNITPLLHPSRKYLGVEINGAPDSLAPAEQFASWVGTKPNIIGQYVAWGTSFDTTAASNAWSYGALDFVVWEPWNTTLAKIASGASDTYIESFAASVRSLDKPIALSFGHEFNGNWYPWGTTGTTAADFVAAWQHIHKLFAAAGATNVIWIWDPNDIFPVQNVQLAKYYPGDAYVDWVGVTGYWTQGGPNTYDSLYLPTLEEIREFTQKPFIIAETSVESGSNETESLTQLFDTVEQHSDIVGFVWYDFDKGGDWRIENRPVLLSDFRTDLSGGDFGAAVTAAK
jgi:mannan endo-1,4-beta-mannosidase